LHAELESVVNNGDLGGGAGVVNSKTNQKKEVGRRIQVPQREGDGKKKSVYNSIESRRSKDDNDERQSNIHGL
jgi:hypothetical protein